MPKLTTIDSTTCRTLAQRINELLKPLEAEFGVTAKVKGGTYGAGFYTAKVEVAIINADGTVENRERDAFRALATSYDLEPTDLGRTFTAQGRTFTISGLSPKSPKRPILATDASGRTFKFSDEYVARILKQTASK